MAFSDRLLRLVLLFSAIATSATAHEHHEEDIPEGQGISADPIVSSSNPMNARRMLTVVLGLNIMDTYNDPDDCLWHYLSCWNGAWSMLPTTGFSCGATQWRTNMSIM
jgi:hypothetical protein